MKKKILILFLGAVILSVSYIAVVSADNQKSTYESAQEGDSYCTEEYYIEGIKYDYDPYSEGVISEMMQANTFYKTDVDMDEYTDAVKVESWKCDNGETIKCMWLDNGTVLTEITTTEKYELDN